MNAAQVETVADLLVNAAHAVEGAGWEVVAIEMAPGALMPSLVVRPTPAAKDLDGAVRGVETMSDGSRAEFVETKLHGCRVRWRP